MKDLSVLQLSLKSNLINNLVNSFNDQYKKTNNLTIRLLNSGSAFPVAADFDIKLFADASVNFISENLGLSVIIESVDQLFVIKLNHGNKFSLPKPAAFKKNIVFMLFNGYLYICKANENHIENPLAGDGTWMRLFSGNIFDKILLFAENFILSGYSQSIIDNISFKNRYTESFVDGLRCFLAKHFEPDEVLLANLGAYKLKKCKDLSALNQCDDCRLIITTEGAWILGFRGSMQLRYFEDLSQNKFTLKNRIGRDVASCGDVQFLTNLDNDFLYDEIKDAVNVDKLEKLLIAARQNYNFAQSADDKLSATSLLQLYLRFTGDSVADYFARLISLSVKCADMRFIEASEIEDFFECARVCLLRNDFFIRFERFVEEYNFSSVDVAVICASLEHFPVADSIKKDVEKMFLILRDEFYRAEKDDLNRAFFDIRVAHRFFLSGNLYLAGKIAKEVFDSVPDEYAIAFVPRTDINPASVCSGRVLKYAAVDLLVAASEEKRNYRYLALERAVLRPLNIENIFALLNENIEPLLVEKAETVLSFFDLDKFNDDRQYIDLLPVDKTVSKISKALLAHPAAAKGKLYQNIDAYIKKAETPDFSDLAKYGEIVSDINFPALNYAVKYLADFFEMSPPAVFVYRGQRATGFNSYIDEKPFVIVGYNHLNVESDRYLNPAELYFSLARVFSDIRYGYSKFNALSFWSALPDKLKVPDQVPPGSLPVPEFIQNRADEFFRMRNIAGNISAVADSFHEVNTNYIAQIQILIDTLNYSADNIMHGNIKDFEYAALSAFMRNSSDRFGLLFCGNPVDAVNAMIVTDAAIDNPRRIFKNSTVYSYISQKDHDGYYLNAGFALRVSDLLSFYLSNTYSTLQKEIFKK